MVTQVLWRRLVNGKFGKFLGFVDGQKFSETEIKRAGKKRACKYRVVAKQKFKGARIEIDGAEHTVGILGVKEAKNDPLGGLKLRGKKVVPFECGYFARCVFPLRLFSPRAH